jgi:hypothetical protein
MMAVFHHYGNSHFICTFAVPHRIDENLKFIEYRTCYRYNALRVHLTISVTPEKIPQFWAELQLRIPILSNANTVSDPNSGH